MFTDKSQYNLLLSTYNYLLLLFTAIIPILGPKDRRRCSSSKEHKGRAWGPTNQPADKTQQTELILFENVINLGRVQRFQTLAKNSGHGPFFCPPPPPLLAGTKFNITIIIICVLYYDPV